MSIKKRTLNVSEDVRDYLINLKNKNRDKYHSVDEILRERFNIR